MDSRYHIRPVDRLGGRLDAGSPSARLFTRPKMGFGVPLDRWLREDLRPMVEDYLSPARLKQEGVLNPAAVEEKVSAHMSGKISHKDCLWAALMWEMWREKWLM